MLLKDTIIGCQTFKICMLNLCGESTILCNFCNICMDTDSLNLAAMMERLGGGGGVRMVIVCYETKIEIRKYHR